MTFANCPRCDEQVSVPAGASPEATVRCPLCQEEYSLGAALALLPPSLIVVADVENPPSPALTDEGDSPWTAINLDDNNADEVALAPMEDVSAAPFDFAGSPATTGSQPTAAIRSRSRSRKPKGSPVKSVLSIVIGGVMAFPIAQLILWYLPGDLKRDFGAGPIVAQYIPAIVPAKFRGGSANTEDDSQSGFQDSTSTTSEFDFGDTDKFVVADEEDQNNQQNNERQSPLDEVGGFPGTEEPADRESMNIDDTVAAGEDVFGSEVELPELDLEGLSSIDEPARPIELPGAIVEATEEQNSEPPPLGDAPTTIEAPAAEVAGLATGNVRDAPQVTADDVVKAFQAALSGSVAWDTNEASSPSSALKQEFYYSLSKLGEALTFANHTDEKVASQVAETGRLLQAIGKQPAKLAVVNQVAHGWMRAGHARRRTDGICLYGSVKSVTPIGDLFETSVECGGKQISVVSKSDPLEYVAVEGKVLVLGTILDEPTKNLGGYEGSHPIVVLDGYHMSFMAE